MKNRLTDDTRHDTPAAGRDKNGAWPDDEASVLHIISHPVEDHPADRPVVHLPEAVPRPDVEVLDQRAAEQGLGLDEPAAERPLRAVGLAEGDRERQPVSP